LTRLREAQNKKSKVSRGSFRQSRPGTTPPSGEEVIRSQALDRALDRARRRPRRRPSTSRAHTHIATAIIVTLAPVNAHATPPRARAIVDIQRSIAHRSQPSSHGHAASSFVIVAPRPSLLLVRIVIVPFACSSS
jgi:hypothetical protein